MRRPTQTDVRSPGGSDCAGQAWFGEDPDLMTALDEAAGDSQLRRNVAATLPTARTEICSSSASDNSTAQIGDHFLHVGLIKLHVPPQELPCVDVGGHDEFKDLTAS